MIKLKLNPTSAELRQFGFIALGVFGALGALLYWHVLPLARSLGGATPVVAYVLWAIAAVSGLWSLVAPRGNRPLFIVLSIVAYPIGSVVSYVVMAIFFFGILTPLGLVFRLSGRDALQRRLEPGALTYWMARKPAEGVERYFAQH